MALDGFPAVPRTLAAWHRYREECWRRQRPDWIPYVFRIQWPEGTEVGPTWWSFAPYHPLAGQGFCWRCLADAQGIEGSTVPHIRQRHGVICWSEAPTADGVEQVQAVGNQPAEDGQPDGKQAGPELTTLEITFCTPNPEWLKALGADPAQPITIRQDGQPPVQASFVRFTRLDEEGRPVGPPIVFPSPPDPWDGFPSWTDDAEAEPAGPDIAEWPPPPVEIPLQGDPWYAQDWQPEEDGET